MDLLLSRKSVPIISLGLLSLLLVLWLRPIGDELSTSHVLLPMEPFENVEAIVRQILEENQVASSSGGQQNRPSLKDEIEQAKSRLPRNDYNAAKSNYQRMLEHIEKLEKYKKDPLKFDNQGFLRNAPNNQVRQKIIESRIAHLEQEIQTFYNNIVKIISY